MHPLPETLSCEQKPDSPSAKTILLVCAADDSRIAAKWFLTVSGYVVDAVRSAQEAISVFDAAIHDMVVTDDPIPGMTGVEMAHIIKLRSPATPVVMYACKPPSDCSCLDLVVEKSAHIVVLKTGMDRIFAAH
jgi:CheY-like chemotaxis protein